MQTKRITNLVQVKITLAEKYEHLAKVNASRPRAARYIRRARSYRRQAADLQRLALQK